MPQLIGLMVVGAGLYAAYKAIGRVAQQVSAQMSHADGERKRRTADVRVTEKDLGALEWDEAQQIYRPKALR
jgi:hypothetical protein